MYGKKKISFVLIILMLITAVLSVGTKPVYAAGESKVSVSTSYNGSFGGGRVNITVNGFERGWASNGWGNVAVEDGTEVTIGARPEDGYHFVKWERRSPMGLPMYDFSYDAEYTFRADAISDPYYYLFAIFEKDPVDYTLSFDANGGSGSMDPVTKEEGETWEVPECGFEAPENQVFRGWNTLAEGTYNNYGTWYDPGDVITLTENMTLYARWSDPMLSVCAYDSTVGKSMQGGMFTVVNESFPFEREPSYGCNNYTVYMGDRFIAKAYPDNGYRFVGWYRGEYISRDEDGNPIQDARPYLDDENLLSTEPEYTFTIEGNTVLCPVFESMQITTVDIGNIWTWLDPVNTVPFTAEVHDEDDADGVNFNNKMEISGESWTGSADVPAITSESPGVPVIGETYRYSVVLHAKDGWMFDGSAPGMPFSLIVGGTAVDPEEHMVSVVIGDDGKTAEISFMSDPAAPVTVSQIDLSKADAGNITDRVFTGKKITQTPAVSMDINGTLYTLKSGKDYTVSYRNNTKIGIAETIITGKGNFTGTAERNFRILFTDVKTGHQFFDPIYWAVDGSITKGWDDGTFRSWNTINRAAVVTFLWRLAGEPEPSGIAGFADMPADTAKNQDFRKAISWAAEEGITTGYAGNVFKPWNNCNRAAIITFIWRYAGRPSAQTASFKDMPDDRESYQDFRNAISWGYENGIVTGYDGNLFKPWADCNRAATVTFLYRQFAKSES